MVNHAFQQMIMAAKKLRDNQNRKATFTSPTIAGYYGERFDIKLTQLDLISHHEIEIRASLPFC